jgi:hypothetical protein
MYDPVRHIEKEIRKLRVKASYNQSVAHSHTGIVRDARPSNRHYSHSPLRGRMRRLLRLRKWITSHGKIIWINN